MEKQSLLRANKKLLTPQPPLTHFLGAQFCKKSGHTQGKRYSRLFDRCQFHLNRLASELNLKNQLLNKIKGRKTSTKPRNKKITPSTLLKKKDLLTLNKSLMKSKDVPLYSHGGLDPRKSLGASTFAQHTLFYSLRPLRVTLFLVSMLWYVIRILSTHRTSSLVCFKVLRRRPIFQGKFTSNFVVQA